MFRDSYLFGYGVDLLEHDCVLIISRDVTEEEFGSQVPTPKGNDVRLEISMAAFMLRPVRPGVTHFKFVGNIDPKLSVKKFLFTFFFFDFFFFYSFFFLLSKIIPYWLINWGVKTFAPYFLEMIIKLASDLPETYQKRIEEDEYTYGEIKLRTAEYLKKIEENQKK